MSAAVKAASSSPSWVDPDASDSSSLLHPSSVASDPSQRLRPRPPCHDWIWIIVWAVQLLAVLVIGLVCYRLYRGDVSTSSAVTSSTLPSLTAKSVWLLMTLVGMGVVIGVAYLSMLRHHAEKLIYAGLVVTLLLLVTCSIVAAVQGRWWTMAICMLIIPLFCVWAYFIRDRIPFATNVLVTCTKILNLWPGCTWVALGGVILQAAWFVLWLSCAVSIFYAMKVEFDNGKPASTSDSNPNLRVITAKFVGVLFLLLLSFFWTAQIVKNVVHVCVAGTVATWYFLYPSSMPKSNPVTASLHRACTTSFGGIVLGSLITAVLKALRTTFQLVSRWLTDEDTNCATMALICIVQCILNMIEAIVEYFNTYAFSYMAIYGHSYMKSASAAWSLMQRRGLDAVVNDDLIHGALLIGALGSGGLCALTGGLMAQYVMTGNGDWRIWATIGFLIGLFLAMTVMSVVESAVVSLFVCLADDPAMLRATKPDVYNQLVPEMQRRYDDVDLDVVHHHSAHQRPSGNGGHQV